MKVLQFLQQMFASVGVDRPQPFEKFHSSNRKNSVIFIIFTLTVISISLFMVNESKPFIEQGYSFQEFILFFGLLLILVVLVWKSTIIYESIDHFEKTIEKRIANEKSKAIYDDANKNIEKISVLLDFLFMKVTIYGCMSPFFLITLFNIWTKGSESADYFIPLPFWYPFNWKTFPMGYLSGFFIQIISAFFRMRVAMILTSFVIASYMMVSAFVSDIKQEMKTLNENWKANKNPEELAINLNEIIELHCDAKQSVNYLSDIYEFIFLFNLLWSVSTICVMLLASQMEMSKDNPSIALMANYIITLMYGYGLVFILCEIGERMSNQFDTITEAFNELDWDSFPLAIKQMMPTILIGSQQPVELHAFGNTQLTRATFKKAVNASYSYFTVLTNLQ